MTIKLGVVMDSIHSIHYEKDSTLSMLWEAARRGWEIHYFEQKDLFFRDGNIFGISHSLEVFQDSKQWFSLGRELRIPLAQLDVILMRKDPPFDQEYIYTTYLLELAERIGVFVLNKPQALRDANEKLFTTWFPMCCPQTLVTRSADLLKEFYQEHQNIVCKPLDAMGGSLVFHLKPDDVNAAVVLDVLTQRGTRYTMAQRFVPEIVEGDKRILMIDGEPVDYALARVPKAGDWRGNLAAGAEPIAKPLTKQDRWICEQVGPILREKGLYFVGLDVIGDFLTEINVTSPTGIRELDKQCNLNISSKVLDCIVRYLNQRKKIKVPQCNL